MGELGFVQQGLQSESHGLYVQNHMWLYVENHMNGPLEKSCVKQL